MGANNAPAPRAFAVAAAISSTEVLVWGGADERRTLSSGAIYDLATDDWRPVPPAPIDGRVWAMTAWTGDAVLVFGGARRIDGHVTTLADGAAYDPEEETWRRLAPLPDGARANAGTAWAGSELLCWGGADATSGALGTGMRYHLEADRWEPMSDVGAPSPRHWPGYVWAGETLVVLGGADPRRGIHADGARYDPVDDRWSELPTPPLGPRLGHVVGGLGSSVVAWGGSDGVVDHADGAILGSDSIWRPIPRGPLPEASFWGATAIDDGVFIWGSGRSSIGGFMSAHDSEDAT